MIAEHRLRAAEVLSTMALRKPQGLAVRDDVDKITTSKIAEQLKARADVFVDFFDADHTTDVRQWNAETRSHLREIVTAMAMELASRNDDDWDGKTLRWNAKQLVSVWPDLDKTDTVVEESASPQESPRSGAVESPKKEQTTPQPSPRQESPRRGSL